MAASLGHHWVAKKDEYSVVRWELQTADWSDSDSVVNLADLLAVWWVLVTVDRWVDSLVVKTVAHLVEHWVDQTVHLTAAQSDD